MSYVDKHLITGEHVVERVQLHWIVLAGPSLAAILGAFLVGYTIQWPRSPSQAQAWVMARIVFGIAGVVLLARVIRWCTTECVLTNKRLVVKTGWLRRDLVEIWLTKIEGVQLHQTIVGRLLGYATLVVTGLGGTRELHPNIVAPARFQQAIRRQLDVHL
jgi:uncharacterized membrane protein YdbT with pleckstrin-like domain